jgi:hypothetical protein
MELCISAEVGHIRRRSVAVEGSDDFISSQIETIL